MNVMQNSDLTRKAEHYKTKKLVKKFQRLRILKLKNVNYIYFFFWRGDVDTEKVVVSNKIPFGEKNYKHFIGH